MANTDERAEMISASILAQAEQERQELVAKANAIRDNEIKVFEDQLIQNMFREMQERTTQIRGKSVQSVSAVRQELHRGVLQRREDLEQTLFGAVRARLEEYAQTREYSENLRAEIEVLAGKYDHSHTAIYLREADLGLAPGIRQDLPGCSVEADPSILLGGWKLENTSVGILIDETLDDRLKRQKEWFLLESGWHLD